MMGRTSVGAAALARLLPKHRRRRHGLAAGHHRVAADRHQHVAVLLAGRGRGSSVKHGVKLQAWC